MCSISKFSNLFPLAAGDCSAVRHVDSSLNPSSDRHYSCTVVIPARNEAGTIEAVIRRVPLMGNGTETIVAEGHSRDATWDILQGLATSGEHPNLRILKQKSHGKAGAVREAFAAARGELLFILDADLTVQPEDLVSFYEVVRSGAADFINGTRVLEPGAMQVLNQLANKLFSLGFTCCLGQRLSDTLCGTKVLFRSDYQKMMRMYESAIALDPFGDFALLFGAAKLKLRILNLPVSYRPRVYGKSNIRRWRDGWLLLRTFCRYAGRC